MKLGLVIPVSTSDYDIQLGRIRAHLPADTVTINASDLALETIQREAIDVVVASDLSKDWCYLLRGLGVVTIVFGCLEYYYELVDIVIDYKYGEGDRYFTGPDVDYNKESPASFVPIASLVETLDWDSHFFGIKVAYVSCLHLSENIYKAISRYVIENDIQLVEYLCNCHDRRSVLIAEKEGFTFVDIRLTFAKRLKTFSPVAPTNDFTFRKATEDDIGDLEIMAGRIYTKSRYFFDSNFGIDKAQEFYEGWIRKAVKGEFDDECWCSIHDDQIVAFCSVRYTQEHSAQIGLFGVHEKFAGRGIGRRTIERVIEELAKRGIVELTVVTQGRNYSAQNLYQAVGFKTKETQLWYHKWR
jgi:dTDP-4-amino-4,6-dideoxy-D-galactose acyltransferase